MFEKLTYRGAKCNNYLYFEFYSDYFDADYVTSYLKIKPTSVSSKKVPVPKITSWQFKINVGNDVDLKTPLEKLIDIFESKIDGINYLKEKHGLNSRLQFVIDIDINPETSTPYFGFNKKVVNFLSKTETIVDFDIYKADTIGLLDRL